MYTRATISLTDTEPSSLREADGGDASTGDDQLSCDSSVSQRVPTLWFILCVVEATVLCTTLF